MININNKVLILLGIIVLATVAAAVILLSKSNKINNLLNTGNNNGATNTSMQNAGNPVSESKVTVTEEGFNPKVLNIKAGTSVVWINESGKTATVNSDLYPTNLLWPFLNLGSFGKGESVSTIFSKAGTYTYHNHLEPSQTGTIVVK